MCSLAQGQPAEISGGTHTLRLTTAIDHCSHPPRGMQAPSVQLAKRNATQTAHAGILTACKGIVRDLQSHRILSTLLLPDSEIAQPHGKHRLPDCRCEPFWQPDVRCSPSAAVVNTLYCLLV